MASVERQLINLGKEASMRQGTRLKLNGRGSGFRASEILGILEGTCRVVLFQVSAVDGIPEALVSYMYGTNGDFVTATWIVPRGSFRNVRYQPFGFTLQDRMKARSFTTTTQMPMKRCWLVPARMRRTLPSRRTAKTSSGNCRFAFMRVEMTRFHPNDFIVQR